MIIPNIWKNTIHVPNHQPDHVQQLGSTFFRGELPVWLAGLLAIAPVVRVAPGQHRAIRRKDREGETVGLHMQDWEVKETWDDDGPILIYPMNNNALFSILIIHYFNIDNGIMDLFYLWK